ncbi:hypothetical protein ACFWZY_24790 [Streptomyces sp. NPDC058992]|uniref:hypothetical protein n=1 Tax=Streptomyces sp. NPDC058992 TaxID=3346688 RepID=UPI0036783C4A
MASGAGAAGVSPGACSDTWGAETGEVREAAEGRCVAGASGAAVSGCPAALVVASASARDGTSLVPLCGPPPASARSAPGRGCAAVSGASAGTPPGDTDPDGEAADAGSGGADACV